jgi:plasmid maintenance system antidote protein VapI
MNLETTELISNPHHEDIDDMFSGLEPLRKIDIKLDEISTSLSALMSVSRKSRSDMANMIGCKKSRITKILSGKENVTVKTILSFCSSIGYDFDIFFRKEFENRVRQSWETAPILKINNNTGYFRDIVHLILQSPAEVVEDIKNNEGSPWYIKIERNDNSRICNIIDIMNTSTVNSLPQLEVTNDA